MLGLAVLGRYRAGMRKVTVGVVLIFLAAGCGATKPGGPQPGASSAPQADTFADEGEPGVPEPTLTSHKVGEAFAYTETFSDSTKPVDWSVTVTKIVCGLPVLKNAADNPKWQGDDAIPRHIDAKPPAGKVFCRLDATLKNVGRTSASGPESFGDLVTDLGEFAATYDEETSLPNNLLEAENAPTSPFNPGDTARSVKVWSVPAAAKAVAVLFPDNTVYDKASHRIEVS